jgi:hypothetical protein
VDYCERLVKVGRLNTKSVPSSVSNSAWMGGRSPAVFLEPKSPPTWDKPHPVRSFFLPLLRVHLHTSGRLTTLNMEASKAPGSVGESGEVGAKELTDSARPDRDRS